MTLYGGGKTGRPSADDFPVSNGTISFFRFGFLFRLFFRSLFLERFLRLLLLGRLLLVL